VFESAQGSEARHVQLTNNFFSKSANARNSSEGATPASMSLKYKTLYLMEELPKGALNTQLLKMIAGMDCMSGRELYKGMCGLKYQGRLFINANTAPDLGEESAVWDRAVFIPWLTRYVQGDQKVDKAQWRLPSNTNLAEQIATLTDAFVTVCLQTLTTFLQSRPEATELPMPKVVTELLASERERKFPLQSFAKNYIKQADGLTVEVVSFYKAFGVYCSDRGLVVDMSLTTVLEKFIVIGLTYTTDDKGEQIIPDYTFTPAGLQYAIKGIHGNRVDVPNPDDYVIAQAFKRQRNSHTEETKAYELTDADLEDIDKDINAALEGKAEVTRLLEVTKKIGKGAHTEDEHCRSIGCPGPHYHIKNSNCIQHKCIGPHIILYEEDNF